MRQTTWYCNACGCVFFFKQKTAYEMRISDWSSDVCSSDLHLKLAGLAEGELPDFMIWSGTEALPWWWSLVKSPFAAVAAVLVVPTALGALMAWAIFRRRIGGVYFALIPQALALAFATLLVSQPGLTGDRKSVV